MARAVTPLFFATPEELRAWFFEHHASAEELIAGFYKRDSGRASITWTESVDEALCVGWIDGIRRSIDAVSYQIRFSPRKPASTWSTINIRKVQLLEREGRMLPAGRAAFAKRRAIKSGTYSYEQRPVELPAEYAREFRKDAAAWKFFRSQPPGYRKQCTWYVLSAKREETRRQRLAALVRHSARAERLPYTERYRKTR